MWIELAGRNNIASPGASDARPRRPRMRDQGATASKHRSATTVPFVSVLVSVATCIGDVP
jgi:hypothetical protein